MNDMFKYCNELYKILLYNNNLFTSMHSNSVYFIVIRSYCFNFVEIIFNAI